MERQVAPEAECKLLDGMPSTGRLEVALSELFFV